MRRCENTIILVGNRKKAVEAAHNCGLSPLVIDVKARKEQTPFAFGGSRSWALEQAIGHCRDTPPVAVVAVATGSVTAAAAIREHYQLPGISSRTALSCHDKLVMKKALADRNLPCAPWHETTEDTTPHQLIRRLGLPLVFKKPVSSGGRGVVICNSEREVAKHLEPDLLAEGFVTGIEMSVETIRQNGKNLFRNHTSYLVPRVSSIVPAQLTSSQLEEINRLSDQIHEALGITDGITHMEIFLTSSGPVFGEIAARPPGGYLMDLIRQAYQFDPWEALIRVSMGESPSLPTRASCHAGVWLLHPGEGVVRSIDGREETLAVPGITTLACKLKPGDQIDRRIGSGESVGQLFATAPDFPQCEAALKTAAASVKINLSHR